MTDHRSGKVRCLGIGLVMVAAIPIAAGPAEAHYYGSAHHAHNYARGYYGGYASYGGGYRRYARGGGLQCVPFARADSGIEISGNANTWWYNAQGVYARGNRPEIGAVLSFAATYRMRLGHVAVVSAVLGPREIEIDQANWHRGQVSRGVSVVDVSPNNDWTAVRVGLASDAEFGSTYPTHGFIYNRADTGSLLANNSVPNAPVPAVAASGGVSGTQVASVASSNAALPAPVTGWSGRTLFSTPINLNAPGTVSGGTVSGAEDEVAEAPAFPRARGYHASYAHSAYSRASYGWATYEAPRRHGGEPAYRASVRPHYAPVAPVAPVAYELTVHHKPRHRG
jgi:surface antigen